MGCGLSTEEKEGKARNEEIENQLKKDKLMQRNEIKMLLLGMLGPFRRRRQLATVPPRDHSRLGLRASLTSPRCW